MEFDNSSERTAVVKRYFTRCLYIYNALVRDAVVKNIIIEERKLVVL